MVSAYVQSKEILPFGFAQQYTENGPFCWESCWPLFSNERNFPSSHTRLASLEVVDRGLAESVLKSSIGVGTFKKEFFCLTQV